MIRNALALTIAAGLWSALVLVTPILTMAGPAAAQDSFQQTDKNGNGLIDHEEYRARMLETFYLEDKDRDGAIAKKDLKGASGADFARADSNGDGSLDMDEFLVVRFLGFNAADRNGDGAVDRKEAKAAGGLN